MTTPLDAEALIPQCKTCRFAQPWEASSFHCHRNPPQLIAFSTLNGDVGVENHWPFVGLTDWCGEYQPAFRAILSEQGA